MKQLLRITVACLIVAGAWVIAPVGCKNSPPVSDTLITASVSAATSVALKTIPALKDHPDKQHAVAQYISRYSAVLYTITGDPTDEELTQLLMAQIPPDVQAQYPEIGAFAVPLIVSFYHWAKAEYGSNTAEFRKVVSDVAQGLKTGSACCLQ